MHNVAIYIKNIARRRLISIIIIYLIDIDKV